MFTIENANLNKTPEVRESIVSTIDHVISSVSITHPVYVTELTGKAASGRIGQVAKTPRNLFRKAHFCLQKIVIM